MDLAREPPVDYQCDSYTVLYIGRHTALLPLVSTCRVCNSRTDCTCTLLYIQKIIYKSTFLQVAIILAKNKSEIQVMKYLKLAKNRTKAHKR